MKKICLTLIAIAWIALNTTAVAAMSTSNVRKNALFLSDRMAHELGLTTMQYDDVYEINFDFIYSVRHIMNDVVKGREYAIERYYALLDVRNDDLRWVLTADQYRRFMGVEYYYRPIYVTAKQWAFRVYRVFSNHNHYYFARPHHYSSYNGLHCRDHHGGRSYYHNRYTHKHHGKPADIRHGNEYRNYRYKDFGVKGQVHGRENARQQPQHRSPQTNKSRDRGVGANKNAQPNVKQPKEGKRKQDDVKRENNRDQRRQSRPAEMKQREKRQDNTNASHNSDKRSRNSSSTGSTTTQRRSRV